MLPGRPFAKFSEQLSEVSERLTTTRSQLERAAEDMSQTVVNVTNLKNNKEHFLNGWTTWKFGRRPTGRKGSPYRREEKGVTQRFHTEDFAAS